MCFKYTPLASSATVKQSEYNVGPETVATSSNTMIGITNHGDMSHPETVCSNVIVQTNACNDASPKMIASSNTLGQTTEYDGKNSFKRLATITVYQPYK